jgi:hypothetical protein
MAISLRSFLALSFAKTDLEGEDDCSLGTVGRAIRRPLFASNANVFGPCVMFQQPSKSSGVRASIPHKVDGSASLAHHAKIESSGVVRIISSCKR